MAPLALQGNENALWTLTLVGFGLLYCLRGR